MSRLTRRGRRRLRPVRILEESVSELPMLTAQDTADLQGALVYDCRPPLLLVSLRLDDIGPLPFRRTVVSASLAAPLQEVVMEIGGVRPEGVAVPELGVAPPFDTDTELEDELPTPEVSLLFHDSRPQGVRLSEVNCPAPRDIVDVELEKALLSVSILPAMVMPLEEPVEVFPVVPSTYPESPVPVLPYDDPGPPSRVSPLRVAADQPILDLFPSYSILPACSVYEPVTSPLTPSLQEDADYRPPHSPATMDQYLSSDGDLLLGGVVDLPLLSMPLTPRPIMVEMDPESSVGSLAGIPVVSPSDGMPDLSREGPFDVHQDALESGATPQVLDSLPGCQYRMASYDDDVDRSDLNLAYWFHLHDPRLLEYVGAPESERLLSCTAEYWLHHMGRDRAMLAVLQLQHDAGLILSNMQVLGQFVTSLNRMSSEVMRVTNRFRRKPSSPWRRLIESDGRLTTWLPWGCDVHRVPRVFLDPCRPHAMLA